MPENDLPGLDDAVGAVLHQDQQNTALQIRNNLASTVTGNPDQAANYQHLAKFVGVPQQTVQAMPDEIKTQAALKQVDADHIAGNYPHLAQFLSDQDNTAKAHDDLPNLANVEKVASVPKAPPTDTKSMLDSFLSMPMEALKGLGGSFNKLATGVGMLAGAFPVMYDKVAGGTEAQDWWFSRQVDPLIERQAAFQPEQNARFPEKAANVLGNTVGALSQIILSGAGAGGGAAVTSETTAGAITKNAIEHGSKSMVVPASSDAIDTGRRVYAETNDPVAATKAALAQYSTSTLGGIIPISMPGSLMTRLITGGASGAATGEISRNIMNAETPEQMHQPFDWEEVALSAMAGMTLAIGGGRDSIRNTLAETNKADVAAEDAQRLQTLSQLSAASKLRERDPEAFNQFVKNATDDGHLENVYIDAKTLTDAFNQSGITVDQLEGTMPEVAKQLHEATETQGDVQIPVADYATHIAGGPVDAAILPHLKTDPEGKTFTEAQEFYKKQLDTFKADAEKIVEKKQAEDAFTQSANEVHDNILGQLEATKRFPSDVNQAYAKMMQAHYMTMAARAGKTPGEVFNEMPLRVGAESLAGGLNQNGKDSILGGVKDNQGSGDNLTDSKPLQPDSGELSRDISEAKDFVSQIEALAEKHGKIYIRWSPTANRDLGGEQQSRDFVSGSAHAGLSAVEVDSKTHPVDIAKALSEYMFLRLQDPRAVPRVYLANRVGTDSDSHSLIKPTQVLLETPESVIRAIDANFAEVIALEDTIANSTKRLNKITDKTGREIVEKSLREARERLGELLNPKQPQRTRGADEFMQGDGAHNRGKFDPKTNTIALLKDADLSTFHHESGHFFLEMLNHFSNTPNIKADMEATLKWFGIEGTPEQTPLERWNSMTNEEKTPYHEKFARGYEHYLMEGKAPSLELQSLFSRFKAWMMRVYKTFSDLNVNIDPEIRGVYDRLLATDSQIKEAQQARGMFPLFNTKPDTMTTQEWENYLSLNKEAQDDAISELQAKSLRDMKWLSNAKSKAMKELQAQANSLRRVARIDARREVLSEPSYQAQGFLTRRMSADDKLPVERKSNPDVLDESRDSLFAAIGKLGGLKRDQVKSEWGIEDKAASGVFGKPVLRAKGGLSLERMAEELANRGYLSVDEHGKYDLKELEEKFGNELRGKPEYSDANDQVEKRPGEGVNVAALGAGRLDRESLHEILAHEPDVFDHLDKQGMVADNGLHPDLVGDMFGFHSGKELAESLAAIPPAKEAIEARTDQIMLQRHGELSTPEAIERAAEAAIHNEARAKVLATELKALAKATGPAAMIAKAAKDAADAAIAQKKIRDLNPKKYEAAESKTAKLADKALAKGDTQEAAQAKRSQILNNRLAKAARETINDISKGLNYFSKFNKESTKEKIHQNYIEQIEYLLEKYDLRKQSNEKRSASLRSWVIARLADNEIPDIAESLLSPESKKIYLSEMRSVNADGEYIYADDAERIKLLSDMIERDSKISYKDMTVEQFKGLLDTVKQIEHLGRLKNKLLTSEKNADLNLVKDEIAASIRDNASKSGRGKPTRDDLISRVRKKVGRFGAAHIRMSVRALVMDGGKDGGPVWEYLVKPANAAEEKQLSMRSAATSHIDSILSPILKDVPVSERMLKGKTYENLGTSLNWTNRFAILLNMGNDGNAQRLLSGGVGGRMGLSMQDIMPVLSEFSKRELLAAQAVWDHFDSYKKELRELEIETKGKEPEWVLPREITIRSRDGVTVRLRGGYYPAVYDPALNAKVMENLETDEGLSALRAARSSAVTRQTFTKQRADEVHGRPLLLTLDALYSGVDAVIHDLSFRRYALDMSKLLRSKRIQDAMREHYGDEAIRQTRLWVRDLIEGPQRIDDAGNAAAAFFRKNVAMTGLGLNILNWLQQPFGIVNTITRLGGGLDGAKWVGKGLTYFASNPKRATQEAMDSSEFIRNRPKTRFRELNEIRNKVQVEGIRSRLAPWMMWGMVRTQMIADVISWRAGYERAVYENPGISEKQAVAIADQVVRDSQGGGEMVDLSHIERGGEISKLFTTFFNFQNTGTNLEYLSSNSKRSRSKKIADFIGLFTVPVLVSMFARNLLVPGDDEEDWKKKLAEAQLSYLIGSVAFVRELSPAVDALFGGKFSSYSGPTGMKTAVDLPVFAKQVAQNEMDDAFRKATINLLGDLTGLPSVQINRSVTGIEALKEGETENPAAVVFGYQKPH